MRSSIYKVYKNRNGQARRGGCAESRLPSFASVYELNIVLPLSRRLAIQAILYFRLINYGVSFSLIVQSRNFQLGRSLSGLESIPRQHLAIFPVQEH